MKKPETFICIAAVLPLLAFWLTAGCRQYEIKPVEIFSEDMCGNCKMAISDLRFASEIILESGEVVKFDDLRCLATYQATHPDRKIAAVFVKDYDTKNWLLRQKAVIVTTGVFTPMGSGEVAFGDSARALEFERQHPVTGE